MENKFPPRRKIRQDEVGFRNVNASIWGNTVYEYHNYVSELEHEAILAGVNNQLQACDRQIDQFQSKLCKQDEAIKVAMEALTNASLYADKDDVNGLAGGIAKEAKQKIEEILK